MIAPSRRQKVTFRRGLVHKKKGERKKTWLGARHQEGFKDSALSVELFVQS